jgi:4-hydroxybenzoate polyprenyltransferase
MDTTVRRSFFTKVGHYLSLIRFSHTLFALPFAFIGFALGIRSLSGNGGTFSLTSSAILFVKMLLCMVFARSAAMAYNRYLDRHFDALNPRTAKREVPAGIISANSALLFTVICSMAFVATTFFINAACFWLSFVALFVILFYSYTKRFTALCHLVLGLGLSFAPVGAYIAVTGRFDWVPVLFGLSVITWVSGFDIIYALQDEDFDKSHQLHSIPAALGAKRALLVSSILHVCSAAFILAAGVTGAFKWVYWLGSLFYCSLLFYQHLLVKPGKLDKVNMAFANTNGIASVVFGAFTIVAILMR